jgi:hypothetical protein
MCNVVECSSIMDDPVISMPNVDKLFLLIPILS